MDKKNDLALEQPKKLIKAQINKLKLIKIKKVIILQTRSSSKIPKTYPKSSNLKKYIK